MMINFRKLYSFNKLPKLSLAKDLILLVTALLILIAFSLYIVCGYSKLFLIVWLLGLAGAGLFFAKQTVPSRNGSVLQKMDYIILLGIAIIASCVYLPYPYSLPFQINTDEIVIRDFVRETIAQQKLLDPLAPSSYLGFPTFIHLLYGWLASALGGITFTHLRTVHALSGILSILVSYVFFRVLRMTRGYALAATTVLGFNHSLIAISRMVSRNNTSLLIEVLALAILFRGLFKQSPLLMYLGGIAAGATFYTYTPARTTLLTFLFAFFLIKWASHNWRGFLSTILPTLVGFAITTFPMIWASYTAPPQYSQYQYDQFLIFPRARELERLQVYAHSVQEGVLTNIYQGLLTFNFPIHDNSNIYLNDGFGFVDTITGIMLWVGLVWLYIRRAKRIASREADLLCSSAFLYLWLVLSFLVTFAPSYTRLLIVLPFVSYLAVQGIGAIGEAVAHFHSRFFSKGNLLVKHITFAGLTLSIIFCNCFILLSYVWAGINEGNKDGSTFRTAAAAAAKSNWNVILASDANYKYYHWGEPENWKEWLDGNDLHGRISILSAKELEASLITSSKQRDQHFTPPFSLFLNRDLFAKAKDLLAKAFPSFTVRNILPDGTLLVVEVH